MPEYTGIITHKRLQEGRRYPLRWLAEREVLRLNADRIAIANYGPSYEYQAVRCDGRWHRWQVVAFQRRLVMK